MIVKKIFSLLSLCGVGLITPLAFAQEVSVTDWRGETVEASEGAVDSDGVKIVYHSAGEGPLVIFVHSIMGPWFDFRHQIVMLAEKYQVVSMSTRGTDKSDKPVGDEHYATAKISEDIAAIIDHLGEEKAVIIGQDSGGLHAWHFAMTRPERTRGIISLGSIHPAGLIRELATNEAQQRASGFQKNMQENPNAGQQLGQMLRNRPAHPDEPANLAELRREAFERMDPKSIVGFYKSNWPVSPVTMETVGFGFKFGEFPTVKAPTLFVYGKNNRVFLGPNLNDMWEWVEGPLTIRVLPGVGHGPHTEAPEIVTPMIMQWLDDLHSEKRSAANANAAGNAGAETTQSPASAVDGVTAEQIMTFMDSNGDGKITEDEAPEEVKAGFSFLDTNGDGGIDVKEAQAMADFANNQQNL